MSENAPTRPAGHPTVAAVAARDALFRHLGAAARGDVNDVAIAAICATWVAGGGVLPWRMGLSAELFDEMLAHHFGSAAGEVAACRRRTESDRDDEIEAFRGLLLAHRAERSRSETWLTELIATATVGYDHLWSDLGLRSRPELTALMRVNYPALAAANTQNMRWKKFLYRQLCEAHGRVLCRAPTCGECGDVAECFPAGEE